MHEELFKQEIANLRTPVSASSGGVSQQAIGVRVDQLNISSSSSSSSRQDPSIIDQHGNSNDLDDAIPSDRNNNNDNNNNNFNSLQPSNGPSSSSSSSSSSSDTRSDLLLPYRYVPTFGELFLPNYDQVKSAQC